MRGSAWARLEDSVVTCSELQHTAAACCAAKSSPQTAASCALSWSSGGVAGTWSTAQGKSGDKSEMADRARGMVFTSAITKFVFKEGRKTVRPADALEELGLFSTSKEAMKTSEGGKELWTPNRVEEQRKTGMKIAQHLIALDELHDQFEQVSEHPFLGKFGVLGTMC